MAARFTFRFFFAELDEARRYCEIETWGGHLGTAFNRAWHRLREQDAYKGIPNLRPTSIDIAPTKKQVKGGSRWAGTGGYNTKVAVG